MYETCPSCGHRPGAGAGKLDICPACGIVYRKWLQKRLGTAAPAATLRADTGPGPGRLFGHWLLRKFLHTEAKVNPFIFAGRALVFAGLAAWGWKFLRLDFVNDYWAIGQSTMHTLNLVFHEAGHVLFRPFGWFMTILGGSLFQLMVPAFLAGMFVFRYGNPFAGAVCTWWLGQSFIDLTPYIDDALEQKLPLLGGHTGADAPGNHDWANILGEFNVMEKHRHYATLADNAGTLLILVALAWGAWLLYRQYRNLEKF